MDSKSVFNLSVCLIGILVLSVHIVSVILKRERRKDENALLLFFAFTMLHFATYMQYTLLKQAYPSDVLTMSFYTGFFIANNIEVLLFYKYMEIYSNFPPKIKKAVGIVNLSLFFAFVLSDVINIFTHMYFTSVDGVYTRGKYMLLCQGYQFVMLVICFIIVMLDKSLLVREKVAFSLYCTLPAISIIVQNLLPGYAIAYLTLLIATEILFLFLNVEKNIRIKEDEKMLEDAHIKIMMSQIRPHFVYNTLSSISTLISIDPGKAAKALDEFTDYLRTNFSSLTETRLIPFEDELKHIKTYVDLEKLRFNKRLDVTYDIKVSDFEIPMLSIQPLVENAIKHGILKKVEGGSVLLKTYSEEKSYVIEIIDNGIGFDMNGVDFASNKHIGLNNVRQRIASMAKGEIEFKSKIDLGTTVVVRIPK